MRLKPSALIVSILLVSSTLALVFNLISVPTATAQIADHVVISEFATRGPGGAYDEFVELYNPTGSAVNIGGWTIEYWSGSSWFSKMTITADTTIEAHKYFLAASSSEYFTTTTADQYHSTRFAFADGTSGAARGIRIKNSGGTVMDTVVCEGNGDTSHAEAEGGSTAPNAATSPQSVERKSGSSHSETRGNGYDTDNNYNDLYRRTTRDPQNSSSPPESYEITLAAPNLVWPDNNENINDNTPNLDWDSASGADNYDVQVDNDSDYSSPEVNADNIGTDDNYQVLLENALPDGVYYWRVRVENVEGTSDWSENWIFRIDKLMPELLSPVDGVNTNDNTPTFEWENRVVADNYELQIDNESSFSAPLIYDNGNITDNQHELPVDNALGDGVYYWRARGYKNGDDSIFSSVWSFRVDTIAPPAPSLTSPDNNENMNDNTPNLTWENLDPIENSTPVRYYVAVSDNSEFPYENENSGGWIENDNYQLTTELTDGDWYWHVMAKDNVGNVGDNSDWWKFHIEKLMPLLLSPADGENTNDNTPTFEWENRVVADNWEIWIDNKADWSTAIVENTAENTYTPATELVDNVYYWRVRGYQGADVSIFPPVRSFRVDTVAPEAPATNAVDAEPDPLIDGDNRIGLTVSSYADARVQDGTYENIRENSLGTPTTDNYNENNTIVERGDNLSSPDNLDVDDGDNYQVSAELSVENTDYYATLEPTTLVDGENSRIGIITGGSIDNVQDNDGVYENIRENNTLSYTYVVSQTENEGGYVDFDNAKADDENYENIYENNYGGGGGGTLTIRPESDSAVTWDPTTASTNYDEVDEEAQDGDTTTVSTSTDEEVDLYEMGDHTTESLPIDNVTVTIWAKNQQNEEVYIRIDSGGTTAESGANVPGTSVYAEFSYTWTTDPNTASAWTWAAIDALKVGVRYNKVGQANLIWVTQVYAEVNYTPGDAYRENIQHNIASIPAGYDNYTLEIEYYIAGDANENIMIYLENFSSGGWDHVDNLDSTTLDNFTYPLTADYISGDNVHVRYVQLDNDSTRTDLMIDYCRVKAENLDYGLRWEHRVTGLQTDGDAYYVRIYGYADSSENFGIYVWDNSNSQWLFIDNLPSGTADWVDNSIQSSYLKGDNLSIMYLSADNTDATPENIHIDYAGVRVVTGKYSIDVRHDSENVSYDGTLTSVRVQLIVGSENTATYTLQIRDWQNSEWDNLETMTINNGTENTFDNTLTTDPENYIKLPTDNIIRVRLITAGIENDHTAQEDWLRFDISYTPPYYALRWEHRIENVDNTYDNYWVRVRGYTSGDSENVGVYIRENQSGTWAWSFIDNLTTTETTIEKYILGENIENYLVGDNLSIKYLSADNTDDTQTTVHIDYCALEWISAALSPPYGVYVEDSTPTFVWDAVTDPSGVTYTLQIDTENTFSAPLEFENTGIPNNTYTLPADNALANDDYYWRVRAVDGAGNIGGWSPVWQFTFEDVVAPAKPINLTAEPDSWTATNLFTVNWTNPSDFSEIIEAYYKFDSAPTSSTDYDGTDSDSPITSTSGITVSGDGSHRIYVWLEDESGNVDHTNNEWTTLYLDTTTPAAPENLTAEPDSWTTENSFSVSWTNPTETSGIAGAYYKLYSAPTSAENGFYTEVSNITSISDIEVSGDGSHSIYVWLKDQAGNVNHANRDNTTFNLDTSAPSTAPSLSAPSDNAATSDPTPTFSWSSVSDLSDVTYKLQIDNENTFSAPLVFENVGIPDNTYTLPGDNALAEGTYYWRVRAVDGAGNIGGWSPVWQFTFVLISPDLISPSDGSFINDTTPTFQWSTVTGVDNYELQYATDNGFTTNLTTIDNIRENQYTPPSGPGWVPLGFTAGTGGRIENVYFMDNDNQWVLTSDLKAHENLLENSDGVDIVMTATGTFTSSNFPYNDGFAIVVALTLNKTDNVYDTYKDNFKVELTFGSWGPENSNNAQETLFSGSEGDATIRVNVEFDNDFVLGPGESATITVKPWVWQYTPSAALADTLWYWRVRVGTDAGDVGPWSDNWQFTVDIDAPGAPTLLAPETGATVATRTPTFDWSDVSDPSGVTYQIQVDASPANWASCAIDVSDLTSSSYTPTTGLADGNYEWRALAVDGAGNASNWSSTRLLTISAQPSSTTLTIDPASFRIKPENSITLTAVLTSGGNPLPDKLITWSATKGTVSPSSGTTDAQGQVSTTYTAPDSERTVVITASFAGDGDYDGSDWSSNGTIKTAPLKLTLAATFIPAGEDHVFNFEPYDIPLFEVTITVEDDMQDAEVTVEVVENIEVSVPPGLVHRFYENITTNIARANIKGLLTRFRVSRSWVVQNDIDVGTIKVLRFSDNRWQELSTERLVDLDDDNYFYFEAEAQGFSLFTLTGEKAAAPMIWILAGVVAMVVLLAIWIRRRYFGPGVRVRIVLKTAIWQILNNRTKLNVKG